MPRTGGRVIDAFKEVWINATFFCMVTVVLSKEETTAIQPAVRAEDFLTQGVHHLPEKFHADPDLFEKVYSVVYSQEF